MKNSFLITIMMSIIACAKSPMPYLSNDNEQSETGTEMDTNTDVVIDTIVDTARDTQSDIDTALHTDTETATETEDNIEPETRSDTTILNNTDTGTDTDTDLDSDTDTGSDTEMDTNTHTVPDSETETRNDTEEMSRCPFSLEGFASINALEQDGTYGGRDGETVTVTNQEALNRFATAEEPYVIRVLGAITLSPKGTEVQVASNKTIIGVGMGGVIVGGGFFLGEGVHNVIIRNLTVKDSYVETEENDFDGIQMDGAHHVWIDHCHFFRIEDGMIDSRKDTTFLTVSWNTFSQQERTFDIGWTDNTISEVTIHHNRMNDVVGMNLSVDNALRAHLYNNFLQSVANFGYYAKGGTNMILENSVFDTVNDPHFGDTGSLVVTGSIYRNTTGKHDSYGTAFFEPSDYYTYTLEPADQIERTIEQCAGPQPELGI